MKFNCFPKKQDMYLVYSNYRVFKSRLFLDLILQSSPKNSIFYRLLESRIGFYISSIFKYSFTTPNDNPNYIGIIKGSRFILFEMDNNNFPINVWRMSNYKDWVQQKFIGFQLLSQYSLVEFNKKYSLIEKAFSIQWDKLKLNTIVHGDFTHFNILVDINDKIHFIDDKAHVNSKLFDFFYFYSYLNDRLCRCQTINDIDKEIILEKLEVMIVKVCSYSLESDFLNDVKDINLPEKWGLSNEDKQTYVLNFQERIISSIKIFNSSIAPNSKQQS